MKKTYIVPEVGLKGNVSGQTDTGWQFGEDGQTGHDPDAKRNGRFWDDEY